MRFGPAKLFGLLLLAAPVRAEPVCFGPTDVDALTVPSPFTEPPYLAAHQSFLRGETERADAALTAALAEAPTAASAPFATLLLAHLKLREGKPASAVPLFEAAAETLPALGAHAAFEGARAAWEAGQPALTLRLAGRIPPEHRHFKEALTLRGRALLALKREGEVISLLAHQPTLSPAARLALGAALEALGDDWGAARQYQRLKGEGEVATKRLNALAKRHGAHLLIEEPIDRLNDARARLARHRAAEAEAALLALLNEPLTDAERCEGWLLLGRAYRLKRKHADAALAYGRFLGLCPEHPGRPDALLAGGQSLFTADHPEEGLRWLDTLWREHPGHRLADDALMLGARLLAEHGQPDEARRRLNALLALAPEGEWAGEAWWRLTEGLLLAGGSLPPDTAEEAEQALENRGRVAYFRARALEAVGQTAEAAAGYERVAERAPMGYYALLALTRLKSLRPERFEQDVAALLSAARPRVVEPPEAVADPELGEGLLLLRLGLGRSAYGAFQAVRRRLKRPERFGLTMAWLYEQAGDLHTRDAILSRDVARLDGYWPHGADRHAFSLVYPVRFSALIQGLAAERGLPAALIFAITREESRFLPKVESWANACGLMQLLVPTAAQLAKADGVGGPITCQRLANPALSLRLGSRYLKDLAARFAHPGLTIAAYHAGYGNVGRWRKRLAELPFDWAVEAIPFVQTRHYLKRVLPTLWAYQWQLSPEAATYAERLPSLALDQRWREAAHPPKDPSISGEPEPPPSP